jgi:hypothetical protein
VIDKIDVIDGKMDEWRVCKMNYRAKWCSRVAIRSIDLFFGQMDRGFVIDVIYTKDDVDLTDRKKSI